MQTDLYFLMDIGLYVTKVIIINKEKDIFNLYQWKNDELDAVQNISTTANTSKDIGTAAVNRVIKEYIKEHDIKNHVLHITLVAKADNQDEIAEWVKKVEKEGAQEIRTDSGVVKYFITAKAFKSDNQSDKYVSVLDIGTGRPEILTYEEYTKLYYRALGYDKRNAEAFIEDNLSIFGDTKSEHNYSRHENKKIFYLAHMDIKGLRLIAGMSRKDFCESFKIPKRTLENWESGINTPPTYVVAQIAYVIMQENNTRLEEYIGENYGSL